MCHNKSHSRESAKEDAAEEAIKIIFPAVLTNIMDFRS